MILQKPKFWTKKYFIDIKEFLESRNVNIKFYVEMTSYDVWTIISPCILVYNGEFHKFDNVCECLDVLFPLYQLLYIDCENKIYNKLYKKIDLDNQLKILKDFNLDNFLN